MGRVSNGKAPPTAVCIASAELDENVYPLSAPTSHIEADVVRLAFAKKGRLVVADWPPPGMDFYRPQNWSELASCETENGTAQCIRTCDQQHGRLTSGCDDWHDSEAEETGEGEDSEPYDLRAAREAAEQADAEAARARDELSYQQCLAACGGGEEAEPNPIARVGLSYTRSPAPGLFQFDVEKLVEGPVVDGKRIFAGLTLDGLPVGVRVSMDGKDKPAQLALDDVCDFGEHLKNKRFAEQCVVARAQREEARVRSARDMAKAAHGVPRLRSG